MSETKTEPNTEHGIAEDVAELSPFSIADAGNVPLIVEPEVRRPRRTRAPHERKTAKDWVWLGLAIVFGLIVAVPFILILINSFKSPTDYNTSGPLRCR